MCGRFTLTADGALIQQALGLEGGVATTPARYNITPSQPIRVLTAQAPKQLRDFKWGLIPAWAKDPAIANQLVNARSESAHEKPSFKSALAARRCLIPTDGWYEWQISGKQKTPMYVHQADFQVFAFAGLWEVWRNPNGEEVYTATVLTTEAAPNIQHIHHRMPVIVPPTRYDAWLHEGNDALYAELFQPYDGQLYAYPVSSRVNRTENDSTDNVIPVDGPPATDQQLSLF